MCGVCGCGEGTTTTLNLQTGAVSTVGGDAAGVHEHVLPDGTRYVHSHDHDGGAGGSGHGHGGHEHGGPESHGHAAGTREPAARAHTHAHAHLREHPGAGDTPRPREVVEIEARVLAKNDALADANRARLAEREVLALNLMSAPGAGKTTLLERTIRDLKGSRDLFVVEGDQATANDGERIRAAGAPVVQVNTGTGCHLDAEMVARGFDELNVSVGSLVFIENVGNLVCPALFDVGEHRRVVILSVTEGDDKPLKYPHMFRAADLVLLNKIDLLPYVDFDVEQATANARAANPDVTILHTSARTGQGLGNWYEWLGRNTLAPAAAAPA